MLFVRSDVIAAASERAQGRASRTVSSGLEKAVERRMLLDWVEAAPLESRVSAMTFDIFLSHAYADRVIVFGLYQLLTQLKFTVYVDWIYDKALNRGVVTPATAEVLRIRMRQCKSLFYVTTDRVLRQITEDASLARLKAVYTPSGSKELPGVPHVRISGSIGKATKGVAFISDGIPTATEIHNRSQLKTGKTPSRIVYDEFGVLQSDLSRLVWLNNLQPQDARNQCVRTIRLCNHLEWIKGL